ncbi:MAG TPA: hypothetical protein VEB21_07090, partial [Terriglobales bacterium]|nr:hypothetical protein [Terriglobales bacterium]
MRIDHALLAGRVDPRARRGAIEVLKATGEIIERIGDEGLARVRSGIDAGDSPAARRSARIANGQTAIAGRAGALDLQIRAVVEAWHQQRSRSNAAVAGVALDDDQEL